MRTFGHKRVVRDETGNPVDIKESPVKAITVEPCGSGFGPDAKRRLIVSLEAGDMVTIRPARTSRRLQVVAKDLYHYLLRCQANLANLEKARNKKEAKAVKRLAAKIKRKEKQLFKPVERKCCHRDNDNDGNCDIHSSPGVYR